MKFVILSPEEFKQFTEVHGNNCYLQSVEIASLREKYGWKAHYVGVKKENNLIAASLLLARKRRLKQEFYAIRGPIVNFEDKELLTFFLTNIKKYVKKQGGYLLRIDPYVEAVSRDKDGNQIDGFDRRFTKDYLKESGFKEVPAKKMGDTVQAKFLYAIDLKDNLEDVLKDMDSKTRQMIRKNEKFGIVTRIGTKEDIALFADIMNDTSNRRHFQDRGLTFYEDMYDALCKENHIAFVFAEMDIDLALQKIEEERTSIDKACIERERKRQKGLCNEEKVKMKEKEEKEALERLAKREDELTSLSQKYGKRITLGGILYVFYGNEVASVFGGCYESLKEYQPFYTIHYEMIQYAINHHYERYNFYAIQNHIDKEDPQYGIYMFKRGFGGHVIELLGEFILPVNKPVYHLMNFFHKIKSR